MAAALPWIALAFTVGSTAYQYQQQKKARKKAKAEADARKGFELVIEGSPGVLPIIYGKAKVGGVRCFHNTSSNFNYVASNANKTFNINLEASLSGAKNEFLIFQQAICQGGISSVKDIIINETQFLNDPVLSDRAGIRVDVHFNGSVVDPLLKANAPERATALFSNVAYANVYIKLNRDDPQFGGVPDIQFLVEGRKVRKVINGVLQTTYVYSNNPAWVLLDYLLEFRKVPVEDIILSSFEQSADLADTIKLTGATVGGNFYRPALDSTQIFGRNIPLYETNIALDSAKPFRENVEAILETMGDARLVWSQGKYKLNAQYPGVNNENIIISDYITDDDLVLGKSITINWPSAEERLNNVTVRFNNESENFKEDTVSWPNKPNSAYTRGIGGFVYPAVSGWETSEGGRLLNSYGVWNLGSDTSSLVYKIRPSVTGDHTLRYTADDVVSGTINEYTFYSNFWNRYLNGQSTGTGILRYNLSFNNQTQVKSQTVYLEEGKTYEISLNATNHKNKKGIAATLTDPANVVIWTTREPSYAGFEEVSSDNSAYLAMLAEDNNIELETDVFLQGTTDYYHAKAKAEELVRTSRTAFSIKFTYIAKDKYLEPGDIIQLSSENIQIGLEGPLYIRVSSITLKPDFQCEIQGTRFDGTQLAWNVADNEYLRPISSYNEQLPAPYYLEYLPDANDIHNGPGSLNWPPVEDARIVSYNLYMHKEGETDQAGYNLFKKIGSTPNPPFGLPDLVEKDLIFGIKSVANTGRMSNMTITNTINLVRAAPPQPTSLAATAFGDRNQSVKLTWNIPLNRADGSVYNNHFATFIYRSKINNFEQAQKIGEVSQTSVYIDTPSEYGTLFYWVKFVSYAGVLGPISGVVSLSVDFWQIFTDNTFKPPAPTNLQASGVVNSIILTWEQTSYSDGGGHDYAIVYGQKWSDGAAEPTFSYDTVISTVKDAKIYRHTVEPGERWIYWVKEKSRNSGLSDGYAGPAAATTEYDPAKLVSALSGHIAKSTLSTELQAEIDSVDPLAIQVMSNKIDDVYGSYTVKIDHNNHVSGYGLASEANDGTPISSFIVAADRFAIGAPTVTNGDFNLNNQYPFIHLSTPTVVDGITMQPGTYLKRAFIADATITNAKIITLDAEKITSGFIHADRFEAGSINASKIDSRGLSIYNEFGEVILAAGIGAEGLDWDFVKGSAKPQDGATRNVYKGVWTTSTSYIIGDIVLYEGNGWSCIQNHTSSGAQVPPASGISNSYWTIHALKGDRGASGLPGVNGTRTAILDMYKWAANQPTTGFPSGNSTYTWSTAQFTAPANPNDWELTPPAPVTGQTLWIVRQLYSDQETSVQSIIGWSANIATPAGASGPRGPAGEAGTRTGILELYRWAPTTPNAFPIGTSVYTWATGEFTLPVTLNGWTLLPGAPVAGQLLWACSVRIINSDSAATSTRTWESPVVYAIGGSGLNALVATLDNEAHSCPATFDGASVNYAGSGCKISVYEGTTPLVFTTGTATAGQFSIGTPVVSPAGKITVGARSGNGTTTATVAVHSGFLADTDVVTITYPITAKRADDTAVSISKIQTISKSKAGAQGAMGPTVSVDSSRAATFLATDGTINSGQTNIVFTATTQGITSPAYVWTFERVDGTGTNPSASTTSTFTVTQANFGTSKSAKVTCTVNGLYKDTFPIVLLDRSTADPGATVGADWYINVTNRPDPASFLETFESGSVAQWTNHGGLGELSVVSAADSVTGGKVLRIGNNSDNDQAWLIHKQNIPFDPSALYRIKFRVRRTVGTGTVYLGVAGVAADGVTWVNTSGANGSSSQHYVAASGQNPGSAWTEYVGYVKGTAATGQTGTNPSITAPLKLHQNVRYIRPLIIANYQLAAGTLEVDYCSVELMTDAMSWDAVAGEGKDAIVNTLADIASDSKLTPAEKKITKKEWDGIVAEKSGINSQASALGITGENNTYNNAYNALNTYITPLLSSLTTTSNIVGSTFRSTFSTFYSARQALLNKIADAASKSATWSLIAARPDDSSNLVEKSVFSDGSRGTWGAGTVVGISGQPFSHALEVSARDCYADGWFPVTPGEKLYVSAWLDASTCNGQLRVGINAQTSAGTDQWLAPAFINAGVGWTFVTGEIVVPSNCIRARGFIQVLLTSNFGTGRISFVRLSRTQDGATVGAPVGTLVAGVSAASVATAITDFNASNNRNGSAITDPTILTNGSAVDHVAQKDGSVDISFEWDWSGNEGDIDGFLVYARSSAVSAVYALGTTPAEETVYAVPANKRAFILFGVAADKYYTFGVQAYRVVDKAINAAGVIKSALVKATGSGENPYRPSSTVAFTGDVTGTIDGTNAATLVLTASNALSAAGAAQQDATKALDDLADIAADNKLTPAEKKAVRKEWDQILAERASILIQADSFGITTEKTNYINDFNTLATYLNNLTTYSLSTTSPYTPPTTPPNWITDANLSVTSTIVGSAFRNYWKNMYADRQALLNKIAAEAAKRANWALTSGKPDDEDILNAGHPLNKNPDLQGAIDGADSAPSWTRVIASTPAFAGIRIEAAGSNYGPPWDRESPMFYATIADTANAVNEQAYWVTETFRIDISKPHCLSGWARKMWIPGTPKVYFRVRCYDKDSVSLGFISHYSAYTGLTTTWEQMVKKIEPADWPAGTYKVRIEWYGAYQQYGSSVATRLMLNEGRVPTKNLAPPVVDIDAHLTRDGSPVYSSDFLSSWNKVDEAKMTNFFASQSISNNYIKDVAVGKLIAGAIGVGTWISSTNYAAGSAGWKINANGSAEFRNITARGDIEASSLKANTVMVDTLHIAGNAVVVPTFVEYPSGTSYNEYHIDTATEWTLLSDVVTVNADCSAIIIIGSNDEKTSVKHTVSAGAGGRGHYNWPTGTEWASIRLYRNGTLVKRLAQWNVDGTKRGAGKHMGVYIGIEQDCVFVDELTVQVNLVAGANTIDIRGWVRMADGDACARRLPNAYMQIIGAQR